MRPPRPWGPRGPPGCTAPGPGSHHLRNPAAEGCGTRIRGTRGGPMTQLCFPLHGEHPKGSACTPFPARSSAPGGPAGRRYRWMCAVPPSAPRRFHPAKTWRGGKSPCLGRHCCRVEGAQPKWWLSPAGGHPVALLRSTCSSHAGVYWPLWASITEGTTVAALSYLRTAARGR